MERKGSIYREQATRAALFDDVVVQEERAKRSNAEVLDGVISQLQEADELGSDTLVQLGEQSEQLRRIDQGLADMNATLTVSERVISGIKSWSGMIWNAIAPPAPVAAVKAQHMHKPSAEAKAREKEKVRRLSKLPQQESKNQAMLAEHRAISAERKISVESEPRRDSLMSSSQRGRGGGDVSLSGPSDFSQASRQLEDEAEEDKQLDVISDLLVGLKEKAIVTNM